MDRTLRLYANPVKLLLLLIFFLGLVVAGWFMLHDPTVRANARQLIAAYACVGLCGLLVVVALITLVRDSILRRPILSIDAHGWTYPASLGMQTKHISWADLSGIEIRRQQTAASPMYYLVLKARYPDKLPPSRWRALQASMYPSVADAALLVPLSSVYVRTMPVKAERLLHDIQTRFASEIYSNGITIGDKVRRL